MKPTFIYTRQGVRIGYLAENFMGCSYVKLYLNCKRGEAYKINIPQNENVKFVTYFSSHGDGIVTYMRNKTYERPVLYVRNMFLYEFENFLYNVEIDKYIDFEDNPNNISSQLLTILN